MKRFALLALSVLLPIAALSGCARNIKPESDKISIVCTIFPQYDWVRQILGGNAADIDLFLLLDNSIDLHSYQPTFDDIIKISSCDLFIYVGSDSDRWVGDVLKEPVNGEMVVVNLLETLGTAAKAEEIIEGMENDERSSENKHETEYDEHVWLSLKNARLYCEVIADALSSLDSDNAVEYQNNTSAYIERITELDNEYQRTVDTAPVGTLLFGDRFPFRYLVDDYGINYYAAFPGCSTETKADFETIIFLAEKADELNLKNIMVTESADVSLAGSIIGNTSGKDQQILVLDAMQSVSADDVQNGLTYLSVMESNLKVLKDALGV